MAKIFAIANQKGGVGKTTTSVNLCASLGAVGRRVLLVDLDPQGNATVGSGVDKEAFEVSVYDVLLREVTILNAILDRSEIGYRLLPANGDLTGAEVNLLNAPDKELRLREAFRAVIQHFDFIFIDCPPSLNMLTINALVAADAVLIPIQCEYYALEGVAALRKTVEMIRSRLNPRLEIEGVLRTMFDARNNLANEVSADLIEHFGAKVYRSIIPRNVRLAEAPSHGLPALHFDKLSSGAMAYMALAGEVMQKYPDLRAPDLQV